MNEVREGGCLCGAVRYRIDGPMRDIIGCHCSQCRRTTGHYLPATAVRKRHFHLTMESGLKAYNSSPSARRWFCGECGSSLFWTLVDRDQVSIVAGSLDDTGGLRIAAHIFTEDKGAYYDLDNRIPAFAANSDGSVAFPE